ncbi:hypothetical protein [uncultured Lamprocystis sp.]|jgi:hypothetical protein|uniref:hypothetical protein n=1 Tax=uncultured Lamprocystis sp. TaxID=543132 RepID=UPI0025E5C498|nr:hypothetical protein [uncultured Lamprocystis sp.]
MGEHIVTGFCRAPELVLLGESGLTPLDLPGRTFRVRRLWRSGLNERLCGRLGVFLGVTYWSDGDWQTCFRFSKHSGFFQDEDLFEVLACVEFSRLVWRTSKCS